ncbi:non-canonical purine NTP pyrophosphatase [Atlantibacter hermannii]|uniref:non-canonical purine NTP pyrophosphatase n=1 Tax=Atlantibacter hermannii TaxID=565 RepID=UPI00290ACEC9|nr:non-canonical purine NTP pyrophosphatase [Atlantibacter hermannii]MDU7391132.1 non-canonical purine NTP pyrophosphatase [Atlantibacter hermannii]
MRLHFLSNNPNKIKEINDILGDKVKVLSANIKIEEIQSKNTLGLVRDKLLKAFKQIGRPVFVEHTGLYLKSLKELPGGLTQIFWDDLEAEGFISLLNAYQDKTAIAKTVIGYCDGKKIHFFEGKVEGTISDVPLGNRNFQWDCIFIPDGYQESFAQMGDKKNKISMRKLALDKLSSHLQEEK